MPTQFPPVAEQIKAIRKRLDNLDDLIVTLGDEIDREDDFTEFAEEIWCDALRECSATLTGIANITCRDNPTAEGSV